MAFRSSVDSKIDQARGAAHRAGDDVRDSAEQVYESGRDFAQESLGRISDKIQDLRRDLAGSGQRSRVFGPVVNVMPFDHGFRFAGRYALGENLSAGPVEDLAVAVTVHSDGSPPRLRFDASEALRIGLVNHVFPAGELEARARELAMEIAANAPLAVQAAKRAIDGTWWRERESWLEWEAGQAVGPVLSKDRVAGMRAAAERGRAEFKGT